MYWFRDFNLFDVSSYGLLSLAWLVGGWLLATHAFGLRRPERLLSGAATGFLAFIGLGNLLARVVAITPAFWLAALCVLAAGALAAWRSPRRPWLDWHDLTHWGQWSAFILLLAVFVQIQRGLALFDEYLHMPLISVMAAGDIPPHFYLDPSVYFAYHYGLQVYAASLVNQAGLFPWSAFDLSRALAIVFTLLLGWQWLQRLVRRPWLAAVGSFLLSFSGGARWLLLLLPLPVQEWISNRVVLSNTGSDTAATLLLALGRNWVAEGGGAAHFPFAFHNGIFVPVIFVLDSTGAMPFMTILLMLLLMPPLVHSSQPKLQKTLGWIVWTLIFTTLALSAEHWFAFLWGGLALSVVSAWFIQRARPHTTKIHIQPTTFRIWLAVLGASAVVSAMQGGFITEVVRGFVLKFQGEIPPSANAYGFALRWPPALLSAHLGSLSIFDPAQFIALLAELGPGLILAPLATGYAWRRFQAGDYLEAGLGLVAWLCLIFSLFIQYGVDRSMTRMPSTTLWLWLVGGLPILWLAWRRWRTWKRLAGAAFLISLVAGGVVIFKEQLSVVSSYQFTYFIQPIDAIFSRDYWNRLPADAQVYDRFPERAVTIFGRASRARQTIYEPLDSYRALAANLDPAEMVQAGFTHLYLDDVTWHKLSLEQRKRINQACVDIVRDERVPGDIFRVLYDLSACRPDT